MTAPLIGITTYRNPNRLGYPQNCISEAYVSSLEAAGALPAMIPLGLSESTLDGMLERLDGVLFSGGGDLQPERYGSQPHPLVHNVDLDRDRVELKLFEETIRRGLPFLGICRGLQLINVALGGSLYEDLLDQHPGALRHQAPDEWPRDQLAHTVQLEIDSRLSAILGGTELQVNSQHHQGIRRLAGGLRATAYAPDGIVEAFELPGYPYGLAVQWHPEWLQAHAPMRALFRSFAQAADPAQSDRSEARTTDASSV